MSSGPVLFFYVSSIAAVVAGAVFGFLRGWRFALLGVVVPVALVIVSRLLSNNTLPGSEDMSWRILLVVVAVEAAVLFFACFVVGAGLRVLLDILRRRRLRAPSASRGAPRAW